MMTHDEAIDFQATEQYLLGELSSEQRDAFEDHYFQCAACADDVLAGNAFVGAMRASAARENVFQARKKARPRIYAAPLAAAASVAVALLGWSGWVRPLQTQLAAMSQAGTPAVHVFTETRGEGEATFDRNVPSVLNVRLEPDEVAPSYTWSIVDAQKRVRSSGTFDASQVKDDLTLPMIVVPARSLEPGNYTLRVVSRRDVPHPFTVR